MSVKIINLTAGGGTENIPAYNAFEYLLLTSNSTFTSSWTIQHSGTPIDGMKVKIVYRGTATFDGNTLTIYGAVLPGHLEAIPWEAIATYESGAWKVILTASTTESGAIDGGVIKDGSIMTVKYLDSSVTFEKLESLVEGEIIIGNASNIATALFAAGDAKLLIGDGTTMNSVVISGDIAISNTGVSVIQPGVIQESMLGFSLGDIRVASTTLTQAQVLALNGSPIEILSDAQVAAGSAVIIYATAIDYNFQTSAFTWAGGNMEIQTNTGALLHEVLQADLESGSSKIWYRTQDTQRDLVKGSGLRLMAKSIEPINGDASSTYKVHVFYSIVNF